jgi:hypothetical protein
MRNALICVGAMLAMLLLWPFVFGAAGSAAAAQPRVRAGSAVSMIVPPVPVRAVAPVAVSAPVSLPISAGETCGARHLREAAVCTDGACRLRTDDALDICEGTGFWPA